MNEEVKTYENHAQDSRVREEEVCPTIGASNANGVGTGGNNPLVLATFGKVTHAKNANGDGERYAPVEVAQTLNTFQNQCEGRAVELCVAPDPHAVAVRTANTHANGHGVADEATHTLGVNAGVSTGRNGVALRHIVRRLTPTECERLQAFPDGWTRIPYRGKSADQCPDSPRYKALGNSWATNCAEWILRRIVAAVRLGLIPEGERQ